MTKEVTQKTNIIMTPVNFVRDSYAELKKVHFPTRQETIRSTMGVMSLVLIFAIILGLADWLIGKLVQYILNVSA